MRKAQAQADLDGTIDTTETAFTMHICRPDGFLAVPFVQNFAGSQ